MEKVAPGINLLLVDAYDEVEMSEALSDLFFHRLGRHFGKVEMDVEP